METNKGYIFAGAMLLVGLLVGYGVASYGKQSQPQPPVMSGMQHTMNSMSSGLEGKTGDEFDKAFLSEMIVHHQGAVAMADQVLTTSKRPELLKLAKDIIAAQSSEIQMMRNWQKEWFNQ